MKNIKLCLAICFIIMCVSCGRGYSEGERVGTLTKFSRKGLIIKSWEGELNMGGTRQSDNGVVPTTWRFTVVDDGVAKKVQDAMNSNKQVKCKYTQWLVSSPSMDSDYELIDILVN